MEEEPKKIHVTDGVKVGSKLVLRKLSKDGSEGMRVSEGRRSASVDMEVGGPVNYGTQGERVEGSKDELKVCRTLIEKLNEEGAHWGEPKKPDGPEQGIDCVAYDLHEKKKPLQVQVTHALIEERLGLASWLRSLTPRRL